MHDLTRLFLGLGLLSLSHTAWAGATVAGMPHDRVAKLPKAQRLAMKGEQVVTSPHVSNARATYVSGPRFWNGHDYGEGINAHRKTLGERMAKAGFTQELLDGFEETVQVRTSAIVPGKSHASHFEDHGVKYDNSGQSRSWTEYLSGPGVGGRYSASHGANWDRPDVFAERVDATGKTHSVRLSFDVNVPGVRKATLTRTDRFTTSDGRQVFRQQIREESVREKGGVDVVEYQLDSIDGEKPVRTEMTKHLAPSNTGGKRVIALGGISSPAKGKGLYSGSGKQMTDAEQLEAFKRAAEEKTATLRAAQLAAEAKARPVVAAPAIVAPAVAPVAQTTPAAPARPLWKRLLFLK